MITNLIDVYFQFELTLKQSSIPKRLVKKDFSKTALHLMQRLGIYPEPTPSLVQVTCLELNKRVFPLNLFAKVIGKVQPGWNKMTYAEKRRFVSNNIYRFDVYLNQDKSKKWDYFIYRDKESVKVSRFFMEKNEKIVDWSSYSDLNREITMTERLQKSAVSVLPFDRVDGGLKSVTQNLIKTVPINRDAIELVVEDLNGYYQNSNTKINYLSEIESIKNELNQHPEMASYTLNAKLRKWLEKTPYCYVHGDLSEHNILWNGANYYLIDFDRSFEASVFYDYVYLWLTTSDFNRSLMIEKILMLADTFKVPEYDKKELLRFLLYLFIVDNYRYLNLSGNENRVSVYTQVLIKKGLISWTEILQ